MTISTAPAPLSYAGDDSTKAFAITWKYFAKSHVIATLRSTTGSEATQTLTTHYTLTPAGVSTGGTLTMVTAPATNETLVIELEPPDTQDSDLPLGGPLPSTTIEDELDKASQRDAKLSSVIDRSLRVPKTDTRIGDNLVIPNETDRASQFLSFDGTGAATTAAGTSADLTPVSTFMNGMLDDANAAAVLATLVLDADIATLALPANTTISAYGATVVDDANAAAARTTLGIETSETATGTVTLDANILTSLIDSSGGAVTATLGSKTVPGLKLITMTDASSSSTVSVANSGVLSSTVLYTLNTIDETLILMWTGRIWITIVG